MATLEEGKSKKAIAFLVRPVAFLADRVGRNPAAETTNNHVLLAKDRAQQLVNVIAADKVVDEQKLEAVRPALEEAEAALNTIKPAHIATALIGQTSATHYENHGRRVDPVPA
ncbi:hypothetical protein DAPPUDRAFT_323926 [Daphnia pulex]|uniref:Uncharacterized protein n=1 Tax=Daphnia pulex TaxID=6669 RepID=E9H080_DAPPU|nr:hypothetical protein DAPPUDRAFT_323926 [Daphnia pulex]|eukprot:EFX74753.1 hypothetical protein DAPPUDRAFT_323926 [Daphnia pulex]